MPTTSACSPATSSAKRCGASSRPTISCSTPTTPTPAFDLGRNVPIEHEGESIVGWVAYTYPFNLSGLPAASVPCGFTRAGLPVGLHIVAKALHETDILRAAAAFEAARPWADRRPPAAPQRVSATA